MSVRITDERLDLAIGAYEEDEHEGCAHGRQMVIALKELQQSRALVAELRALAERMEKSIPANHPEHSHFQHGKNFATGTWVASLTSLLAAHDAQQAEGKGE